MASNRFRQVLPNLDPTLYLYNEQEIMPKLDTFGQMVQGLQQSYDFSQEPLPIPKHLQADVQGVQDYYVQPLKNLQQQAIEAFTSGDTSAGLRATKDLRRAIFKAKQPGGKFEQFETNYQAFQNYRDQLNKLYEKGEISSDKRDALLNYSANAFKGSFTEGPDQYNPFSGTSAAKDVQLGERAAELAKGWAADKVQSGRYKILDGQYYDIRTREFIDPQEIYDNVYQQLANDPEVLSFVGQEQLLRGVKPEELISEAAAFAAKKYGFTQEDSKYLKNWALEQSRDQAFQTIQDRGTRSTGYFSVATGGNKLSLDTAGRVKVSEKDLQLPSLMGVPAATTKEGVYVKMGLDEAIEKNPDIIKEHAGLDRIVELMPRNRSMENGKPVVESDEDYNKRIVEAYNDYLDTKGKTYINYQRFDDQQQKRAKAEVFGSSGNESGISPHLTYYMVRPGEPVKLVSKETIMKQIGADNNQELREAATVTGTTDPNNPLVPAGYSILLSHGKQDYQVVASTTTREQAAKQTPFFELFKPKYDLSMSETRAVPLDFGNGNVVPVKSAVRTYVDQNGKVNDELIFYQGETDEEGNIVNWRPTELTEEEIVNYSIQNDPFSEQKINPRLK